MTTIKIKVIGTSITADVSGDLTTGMVGATYEAEYDSAWDGLGKLVIFRAGDEKIIAPDGKVPYVLLTKENVMLQVGVEGRNHDGQIVLPTIWADVGYVVPGAKGEAGPGVEPENPVWKQSAALAQEALEKANSVQQRADSGEFQGPPGPQGPGYEHSEEFYQLALNVRTNAETAENAAKLSGRNASYAASSASAAASSEAGVKADADRAVQAAGEAEQNALTVLNASERAETAANNAVKVGNKAQKAAEQAQTEAQKASNASDKAKKEADRAEKNASIHEGFLVRPALRNGSLGNPGNPDAVGMETVYPTYGAKSIIVRTDIKAQPGNRYHWVYRLSTRNAGISSEPTGMATEASVQTTENWVKIQCKAGTASIKGIAVCVFEKKADGTCVSHRIEETEAAFTLIYNYFDTDAGQNYGLVTISPTAKMTATTSASASDMLMTIQCADSNAEFCINPGRYIRFTEAHQQLPDRTTIRSEGGNTTFTISMNANETLFFDVIKNKFSIVQDTVFPVPEWRVICLQTRINGQSNTQNHGNFVGGTLYNQYIGNLARELVSVKTIDPGAEIYAPKIRKYAQLLAGGDHIDTYLFFTDPHYLGFPDYEDICTGSLDKMKEVYERAPVSYCVCGGDWLQSGDTPQQAAAKLSFADSYARSCFRNYVPVLGNHDTNYQGTEQLTRAAVRNLMFRHEGRAYYTHKSPTTTAYVFDSGTDLAVNMDEYKWDQLAWFAKSLETDDPVHSYVALHIGLDDATNASLPLTDNIIKVMNAYNGRQTIRLNGIDYNFSGKSGTCHYIMAGHNHADYSTTVNGVPVILSEAVILTDNDPQPHGAIHEDAFTLCLADYDSHVLHCVRCGYGEDRTIQIIPTVV